MLEKIKHKGLALAVLAIAQFMVVLDATIVNVALPAIQKALGFATDSDLQWVVTAYALIFGGFLLLGGRLADLFGRRRIFLAGVALFAVASLLGGLAQDPTQLIIFRGLQGLGGAMLAPSALSLVLTIFKEGHERNRALGVWSMVAAGGGAVGLLLGGILTQYIDWRWIFFINVPIALATMVAALKYVPASLKQDKQKLDVTGALTVTGSLMSLVYALAQAPTHGWGSNNVLGMLLLSAALMIAFVVNELRSPHPLVRFDLFKNRNTTGAITIQLLMPAAMFGMFFYFSIYLQHILHYSPTKTGLANVPFTIMIVIIAGVLSRKIAKINPKPLMVVAPLIMAAGLLYASRLPVHANYPTDILPAIVVMASGMAIVFVTGTMMATSGVSHKDSGLISGLLNTMQQVGGALGLAVLTVISTAVTKADMIAANGSPAAQLSATVHGFQRGFIVAALFAVVASFIALIVLKGHKPTKDDLKQEAETEAEALPAAPGV